MDGTTTTVETETEETKTIVATYDTNPYVLYEGRGPPFTKDHGCMLHQIHRILDERNWPTGDAAIPQEISQPVSSMLHVSTKRTRSVAGSNLANLQPENKRRAGSKRGTSSERGKSTKRGTSTKRGMSI